MNKFTHKFLLGSLFVLLGVATVANAQQPNNREVRDAVRSLKSNLDNFEYNLRYQMESTSAPNTSLADASDRIRDLHDSVREFEDNLTLRRENRDDANRVVASARRVDEFLRANPQNRQVEDDWNAVRRQIERLASNYGVAVNWNGQHQAQPAGNFPAPVQSNTVSVGLSGTYDLDTARSENIDDVVADTSLDTEQREDLREKLVAPQQLAIDIRGNQVTLASSNASPITFTADGRDKVEQSASGKNIRVRATLRGQVLTVSSLGGETDYTITFTSVSDGRVMKVSRRITTDYLNQTVFAESVYNKTDSVAQLGIGQPGGNSNYDPNGGYSDNDQTGDGVRGGVPTVATTTRTGNFYVPNGVVLTGNLENEINTKVSQNNDRFRMTVQSPNEYRGATVEGYITGVGNSGRVSGRGNITFNFERITLRNGESYDFAGTLQGITTADGKTVKIDNEGTAESGSQTKKTVKRGGLGAGLGALIGVIAGGAKGAAIGAVIGAGAGAGSVVLQGKENLRLMPGSTITVVSTSPGNSGPR